LRRYNKAAAAHLRREQFPAAVALLLSRTSASGEGGGGLFDSSGRQALTLVHFSAQPEPLMVIEAQEAFTSRLDLMRLCS